jgi:hypothetical protein
MHSYRDTALPNRPAISYDDRRVLVRFAIEIIAIVTFALRTRFMWRRKAHCLSENARLGGGHAQLGARTFAAHKIDRDIGYFRCEAVSRFLHKTESQAQLLR